MFLKHFLLLAFAITLKQSFAYGNIVPQALIDDATKLLNELSELVTSEVTIGRDSLESLTEDFNIFIDNTNSDATLQIATQETTVNDELTEIKDLALSANADISSCLDEREDNFRNLRNIMLEELQNCFLDVYNQSTKAVNNSTYIIELTLNRVESLKYQLDLCKESDTCISILVDQIRLETVELPEAIKVEVSKTTQLFDNLYVLIEGCAQWKVSTYIGTSSAIMSVIEACADAIIG